MHSSKQANEQSGRKLKDQRQRKQSCSTQFTNEHQPQKSISELLSIAKHSSSSCENTGFLDSLPNKRVKRNHPDTTDQIGIPPTTVQPDEMYNLPSMNSKEIASSDPRSKAPEIIEISDSPPRSPFNPPCFHRKPGAPTKTASSAIYTGPKKIVIKNASKKPITDLDQYYNQVWKQLSAALRAIFMNEKVPGSKEELYRGVENLCRQDKASKLFQQLREECKSQLTTRLRDALVSRVAAMEDADVLRAVIQAWLAWNDQLVSNKQAYDLQHIGAHHLQATIRSIFYYLDRSHLHNSALKSIENVEIGDFCSHVFSSTILKPKIIQGVCDLVKSTRQKKESSENKTLITQAINMFYRLDVYTKDFEAQFLSESQCFFLDWVQEMSSAKNLTDYVKESQDLICNETQRSDDFLFDPSTKQCLKTYMDDILVQQKQTWLLKAEDISVLLDQNDVVVLKLLYSLLQRRELGEKLRSPFEAFIRKQGSEIVFDEKRENEMVVRLLEFKKRLDHIWEYAFEMHEALGYALRESFENFINMNKKSTMSWGTDNPKPGEMIAKYVDTILKGGPKAIHAHLSSKMGEKKIPNKNADSSSEDDETELGKKLDQVLDLFRFVHGKAVFEAFYKRDLARRLLLGRSASADAEKSMLIRLKSGKLTFNKTESLC